MHICHVTSVHGPFDTRIFHKMARSAALAGHRVTLVAPHDREEARDGVTVVPIPTVRSRAGRFLRTLTLVRTLTKIGADIYHFHDPELIVVMSLFHRRSGKRVIYDIHEYYREVILSKTWIPRFLRKLGAEVTWRMEVLACRRFECIIAATEELARIYAPYARRTEFIRNYEFREGIELESPRLAKDIDVIHVGTLSFARMAFLLGVAEELWRRGVRCRWCFVGVRPDSSSRALSTIPTECHQYVEMVERIPFEKVREYYRRARIGINYHPLEKRFLVSLPIKVFEYMKHGLAVITTDLPPLRRYVVDGVNGIVVRDNTREGFAEAIAQTLPQDRFEDIAAANRASIANRFNWEMEADRLLRIYDTL